MSAAGARGLRATYHRLLDKVELMLPEKLRPLYNHPAGPPAGTPGLLCTSRLGVSAVKSGSLRSLLCSDMSAPSDRSRASASRSSSSLRSLRGLPERKCA
uniref:Uncharacterized protein n=1 Tax=Oryctolagus cuniculus TaxID=9986 RepID=A0A5F9CJG0_RABIT